MRGGAVGAGERVELELPQAFGLWVAGDQVTGAEDGEVDENAYERGHGSNEKEGREEDVREDLEGGERGPKAKVKWAVEHVHAQRISEGSGSDVHLRGWAVYCKGYCNYGTRRCDPEHTNFC